MGVHGLWKLIEPSGKPVPLETLENRVLAVDVSIWLHQAIKGFRDSKGAPLPNAHLLGIFHRVCKLLYFKIKPVLVFDGGVPVLKKETIAKRNQLKAKHSKDTNKIQKQLLSTLLKHTAVSRVLSEQAKSHLPVKCKPDQPQTDDLFKLPPSQLSSSSSSSASSEDEEAPKHWDMHTIDVNSSGFRSLPADVRHEILTDLKETRKQNSWGRIHELPTESNEFSGYQMKRVLKRRLIQSSLEETEREMGGHSLSLGELESLLNDHGVVTEDVGKRIASDESTRFLYVRDVKEALEKARVGNGEDLKKKAVVENDEDLKKKARVENDEDLKKAVIPEDDSLQEDLEYQRDLNLAIQMSLQDGASTSKAFEGPKKAQTVNDLKIFSAAKGYMMEYSGLTPAGINEIIMGKASDSERDQSIASKVFDAEITLDSPTSTSEVNENATEESSKDELLVAESLIKCRNVNENKASAEKELDSKKIENQRDQTVSSGCIEITSDSDSDVLEAKLEKSQKTLAAEPESDSADDFLEVPVDGLPETNATLESDELESAGNNSFSAKVSPGENNVKNVNSNIDSESDSGDDFLEVPENTTDEAKSALEVVIDPKAGGADDDDIFSDIFGDGFSVDSSKPQLPNREEDGNKKTDGGFSRCGMEKRVDLSKLQLRNRDEKSDACEISKKIVTDVLNGESKLQVLNREEDGNKEADACEVSKKIVTDVSNVEETAAKEKVTPSLSANELRQMERHLESEKESLVVERSNKERLANSITDQMYQEAQELLQLFGVPYIVAPMEAEAQCAFLDEANLTDGTITDDSDIWLFGGKTVYKNFFNQSRHVMEFRSEGIEKHFNLSRLKLIQLSLLVGSDYTEGLQGIGPVTALEILATFPSISFDANVLTPERVTSGLMSFRRWFHSGSIAGPGIAALRTKLKNLEVTENFPSANVARAYVEPEVENNKDQFTWGTPDVVALADFAKQKFGWTQRKSEEILKPVVKRLQETKAQTSIKDYFKTTHKIDSIDLTHKMSKRVKTAVTRMGRGPAPEKKARPRTRKKPPVGEVDEDIAELRRVQAASTSKVREIEEDAKKQLERNLKRTLHAKDVILQKESDRNELMKNKMRAIESFRKSKRGPGFVKRGAKVARRPKDDAELSENSSEDGC